MAIGKFLFLFLFFFVLIFGLSSFFGFCYYPCTTHSNSFLFLWCFFFVWVHVALIVVSILLLTMCGIGVFFVARKKCVDAEREKKQSNHWEKNAYGAGAKEGQKDIETGGVGSFQTSGSGTDRGLPAGVPNLVDQYNSSSLVPGDNGMGYRGGKNRTNSSNIVGEHDEDGRAFPGSIIRSSASQHFTQEGHRQSLSSANAIAQAHKGSYTNQFETIGELVDENNNENGNININGGGGVLNDDKENVTFGVMAKGLGLEMVDNNNKANLTKQQEKSSFARQLANQSSIENDFVMNDIIEDMETVQ